MTILQVWSVIWLVIVIVLGLLTIATGQVWTRAGRRTWLAFSVYIGVVGYLICTILHIFS